MATYTMSQWQHFVNELDGSLQDLHDELDIACQRDQDELGFWESGSLWMNMVTVQDGFGTGKKRVVNWNGLSDFTNHMKVQVHAAYNQMKAVYDDEFNGFKSIPKFIYDQSEKWKDLVPKLQTADQDLRNSKTYQNWTGAGAQAYFETMPKQLSAIGDMALMANNAANNLLTSSQTMGAQYAWIMASFEQMVNSVDEVDGGAYVRSTSLVFWLLDFGKMLKEVAGGIGQQWNSDMYPPVQGMGNYLQDNTELKTANTWPVAANLGGDFTPTAPNPSGMPPGGMPPGGQPQQPQQPQTPGGQPPGVTVPSTPGGGPLDLDHAGGHTDSSAGIGGSPSGSSGHQGSGSSSGFDGGGGSGGGGGGSW